MNILDEYPPEVVKKGVRDMLTWETGRVPDKVEVRQRGAGFVVEITMKRDAVKNHEEFREDLELFLPQGYTLKLEWT